YLQVEAGVAALHAIGRLPGDLLGQAAGQIIEVIHLVAERPAEQAVEGLPAFLATEVPERLIDPRKGIIARLRAMIPQAGPEVIAGDRLTLPGIATDHEGDGRVDRLFDGGDVGS